MRHDTTLATRAVHAGRPSKPDHGAAIQPIFQCAVWEHARADGDYTSVRYPRMQNLPGHEAIGRKLASFEGAEAGTVAASGMAAITTTLIQVLGRGGHLLIQRQLYGGTHAFVVRDLEGLGMRYDFIDPAAPDSWAQKVLPETRAIFVETMTNPLLRVIDHRRVVEFASRHGLCSIVDNTFATPVNFAAARFGYDLVVHSCTKYLNGHSDLVAGAVLGSEARIRKIREMLGHLGGTLDSFACFLLERGTKTLTLRVERQNENALALARHLAGRTEVACVHYPGLETHPDHALAAELLCGHSGVLSIELSAGPGAAKRLCESVELPINGPSLGGVETLITRPATTSHAALSAEERREMGIGDGLVRISVGIESIDDLIADFDRALSACG